MFFKKIKNIFSQTPLFPHYCCPPYGCTTVYSWGVARRGGAALCRKPVPKGCAERARRFAPRVF
jgi:hypothetical protein